MIKQTIKVLAAACVALVSMVSFTACSSESEEQAPQKKKATEATVTVDVYTTALTLKYFKVEAVNGAGNTVELTTENTTEVAGFPKNTYPTVSDFNLSKYGDKMLKYSFGKETYKSFPKSLTYVTYLTPRGQKPADGEQIMAIAVPVLTLENNTAGGTSWTHTNESLTLSATPIPAKNWDKYVATYPRKTGTVNLTFNSASEFDMDGLNISK